MKTNGKILVTGGAGYIGSHAALALLDAGRRVVILDDVSTGFRALVPPGAEFVQGDVGDELVLKNLFSTHRISAIMHFAAKLIAPESVMLPGKYYHTNVGKFAVLLDAAAGAGIQNFIFSSTAAVYGNPAISPVPESTPPAPINPYGASKWMAERVLADMAAAHGLRYVALRYFNVAGADAAGRSGLMSKHATHLVKVAAEVAAGRRESIQIFGDDYPTPDGTGIRDYIHVTDLADAHVKALEYLENGGDNQILNCGYGRGFSVRDVIEKVAAISGRAIKSELAPRRAGDPASIVADSQKIRDVLGWQPRHDSLDEIIRSALAWETMHASA